MKTEEKMTAALEKAKQQKAKAERTIARLKQQADKEVTHEKIVAGAFFGMLLKSGEADPKWFADNAQKMLKEKDYKAVLSFINRNKQ